MIQKLKIFWDPIGFSYDQTQYSKTAVTVRTLRSKAKPVQITVEGNLAGLRGFSGVQIMEVMLRSKSLGGTLLEAFRLSMVLLNSQPKETKKSTRQ